MILSALSLWKKFDLNLPPNAEEGGEIRLLPDGSVTEVTFTGHRVSDGAVRVFSRFYRPFSGEKFHAVLLIPDLTATEEQNEELAAYFLKKGYAVLLLDYAGKQEGKEKYTVYPPSLAYANGDEAKLYSLQTTADKTCWFEWTYTALYAIEYLKTRSDVDNIGAVGIRLGGELVWKIMLSPDLACGVPVNAAGWLTYFDYDKFADNAERNMSDERHKYIAGIESQSYAPFVKNPVLMLCSVRDYSFDYDRAHDTFSRLGNKDGSAIVFCAGSGPCISPDGLTDLELFLEKNLKGRAIFIPEGATIALKEEGGELVADVGIDGGGIVEEAGVFYAETGEESESAYREWQRILKVDGSAVKNGKFSARVSPFKGARYAFLYAYAKYINGFKVVSKIAAKKFEQAGKEHIKSRVIYSGEELACFSVVDHENYAIGGIFLESEAVPKRVEGYGKIRGAYSPGGIRTYKIGSPRYIADENALIEFDAYSKEDVTLVVFAEVSVKGDKFKKYAASTWIKGGGKWKRTILKATDFKATDTGEPLKSFALARALGFEPADGEEETAFAVTNILWL